MEIRGHSGKGISRVGLPQPILHREVKLGKLGGPSLLKGTQGGSSEMDQGVVVCEDVEFSAQEVVTKLLCDCPFKGGVTSTISVALLLRNNSKRKKSNFRSPAPPPYS